MGHFLRFSLPLAVCAILWPLAASGQGGGSATPFPPAAATTVPLERIPHVTRAPRIDDFVEARPREDELAAGDFRQYLPGDGVPGSEGTRAYLSYDDKHLYVVLDRKSTRLNSSHIQKSRMPSSA